MGLGLFFAGLATILNEQAPPASGLDKLIPFGRLFLAIPMAVFGVQHFTAAKVVTSMVPSWIPGHLFWVYLVGTALIASALSITVKKQAGLAATLLGVMLLLFVLLIHIPGVVGHPGDRLRWNVALRDLAFSGGALAFAGAQTKAWRDRGTHPLVGFGRFFIAIPATIFGLEHFLYPEFVPGVPLNKLTPSWIPQHLVWSYLTGAVLVVTGFAVILKKEARLAATALGIMILLLVLFVYLPIVIANPYDIGNGLNYLVDTLAFSGSALVFAETQTREPLKKRAVLENAGLLGS
jgi:uncharacterized membrane protein